MSETLIIVGDRPFHAAGSAQSAGLNVVTLGADEVLKHIHTTPGDGTVLLTGEMENRPELVAAIASVRKLRGSGAEAIRKVRDPEVLPSLPPFAGLKFCKTLPRVGPFRRIVRRVTGNAGLGRVYLIKPANSYGGRRIRPWSRRSKVGASEYVQEAVTGTPMSAIFRSDGWSCVLLGVTEQLVGDEKLGAEPGFASWYGYVGSIGPVSLTTQDRAALSHLGVVLTQRCDLRGVFGVDLIRDRKGRWWPLEVNPRWPASAVVLEQAGGGALLSERGGRAVLPDSAVPQHGLVWSDGRAVMVTGGDRRACYAALVEAFAASIPKRVTVAMPKLEAPTLPSEPEVVRVQGEVLEAPRNKKHLPPPG
ncbi:MAG: ATP-grasp domain-containing protein [Planctomycetota bacterium]